MQHAAASAIALVGEIRLTKSSQDRADALYHLQVLASILQASSETYVPARRVSNTVNSVILQLGYPLPNNAHLDWGSRSLRNFADASPERSHGISPAPPSFPRRTKSSQSQSEAMNSISRHDLSGFDNITQRSSSRAFQPESSRMANPFDHQVEPAEQYCSVFLPNELDMLGLPTLRSPFAPFDGSY